MSVGLSLLSAVISTRDSRIVAELPVRREELVGDEREVYRFVHEHLQQYGVIPERETVETLTGISLPDIPEEPIQFWIDLVRQRSLGIAVSNAVDSITNALKEGNYTEAANIIHATSSTISRSDSSGRVGTLVDLAHDVIAYHDDRQQCRTEGTVPFGFPYLDQISDGLQPGDTIAVAGRTNIGKSYFLCHFAMSAHAAGKIPLFVSMEMSSQQIARRILSLKSRVPENRLSRGNLTSNATRDMVVESIVGLEDEPPFYVIDGKFALRTDEITSLCQALRPDVVYIDGAYLVSTTGTSRSSTRWDKIADVAEDIKIMASRLNIPVMGSYQANADKSIYGSRAIQHLASIVLFLAEYKPEGERESWEMIGQEKTVEIVKGRGGEQGKLKVVFDLQHTVRIYQDEVLINFLPEED
jgi:replicative DNA helicase